ncbi:TonB-dependent receptor [Glaciecola sp. XM2]|jgi:outer membrane receptor protein involved in Fe transport|uniref:TonB-dependent receptor n=1 Tax=Glaciecola sp. XM2 TaxID=1914931 RepID=UPI001BDDE781|nr:TonB-dependent receptor [Glaciecola sp. XM2]MBT1450145.1 TonB-dependent receptor [Glaciecola sp. XM2]
MIQELSDKFSPKPLAAIIALSLGLMSNVAGAQETQDAQGAEQADDEFEVIMVTASKRSTGLQETPIAISVTSAEDIEQTKVLDIGDLQSIVPTLRVTPLQRSTNTNFAIRGFGNGTNNTGIEPSVGVFIDGVYRSRAAAQIGDLPRLEQVEILSGPQSTLFGKNASAGVINVRTAAPTYSLEGKTELTIGNYNQRILKGYVSNGISETLAVSLSGGINKRDGFTDSVVGLGDLNNRDRWNIRGQALYEPSSDVVVRIIADYSEIDERCCTVADVINGPTTAAVRALGGVVLDTDDPFAYESALNTDSDNTVEDGGVSMQIDVDYGSFALTSISAFRNNKSGYFSDVDYTSLDILTEDGRTDIDTFTQEFRLTSNGDNTFDWMVGGFYFDEQVDTGDTLFYGDGTRPYFNALGLAPLLGGVEGVFGLAPGTFFGAGPQIDTNFMQDNTAYSLFVSLDYDLTEQLTATLGLSYTNDEKDVTVNQTNTEALSAIDLNATPTLFNVPVSAIPDLAPFVPTLQGVQFLPQQLIFPNAIEDGNSNDSKTTWSLRLAYELNRNVSFFATAATGFKATSWNLSRDTRPFPSDQAALDAAGLLENNQSYGTRFAGPEESKVYELGVKTRFRDGAFNATIFDQTIEGFQSSTFVGTGFVLANAGQQSTKGIEFDSVYRPTDSIDLTFAGIILDPVYDSFVGASGINGPIDLTGQQPFGIHERSFNAGITYNYDLDNGMFGYVRLDYQYESEIELVSNVPPELTREVSTFNASAGLSMDNGLSFQVWVRNLNNDEFFLTAFPPPIQAGSFNAYPNQPRLFGLSVSYQFD